MQQISATRKRVYLTALSQEIQKKLQRAEENPSQRRNLLQELFADIALEVDDRAKEIILSRGADSIARVEDGPEDHLCFYDVLSSHFVQVPEDGQPILDLIVKLWSQSFASQIFVLLFHKWDKSIASAVVLTIKGQFYHAIGELRLFEVVIEDSEKLLRYSSALVQGCANVFWIDIQTNTRRFRSVFHYLLEDVALDQSRLTKLVLQAQRDLFLLLSRYIFFYNAVDKLDAFLNKFPPFPNSFLIGGPGDIFVIELTDQLQKLKVEPVLLHYLSQIKDLQGLELRMTTCTRLKTCLYSFTSPGGPMYPTRVVRHAARDALDALFPVGQYPRHLISLFFRLLYPWYWPSSCWYFVVSCIKALFYSVIGLIVSNWEALRGRRMSKRDM